jgi:SAM-dependent methyltransferase
MSVLDLPCGAGRFWPMLAERAGRTIIGADNSADMVAIAMKAQPADVVARVKPMQTSAFAIDLPDASVDCVFCMRLLHHIGDKEHRATMFREFARVSRDSVVISLWVDGNLQSWRRNRVEKRRAAKGKGERVQNRFVQPRAAIEAEFNGAGLNVTGSIGMFPVFSMWRTYVLRKAK